MGVQTSLPQGRVANNYGIQDTFTILKGTHNIRFGGDLLLQRSKQFAPFVERGLLAYAATSSEFTGFANFVDDFSGSNGSAQRDFGDPAYYPDLFRQAYFVQDRWRVNQSLTLTFGLRYENFGLPMNSLRTPAYEGLFNVGPGDLQRTVLQSESSAGRQQQLRAVAGNRVESVGGERGVGLAAGAEEDRNPHRVPDGVRLVLQQHRVECGGIEP